MDKKISNKQKNQPYNTRVGFDDKIYIARNETSIPPLSQGAVDGAVKYKPITEELSAFEAQKMIDNAINVVERHLEHYKNSPNKEILNPEELLRATQNLVDKRTFNKFHDDDLYTFHMYAEVGRKLLNKQVNENKTNMKQIHISESTLKDVIRESVKKHLKEYRQTYSSMGRSYNYTVELESEDELQYTLEASVTITGDGYDSDVDINNVDLVEGSYDPSEIDEIEAELSRNYDRNMEKIQEMALEMQENDRHDAESKGW